MTTDVSCRLFEFDFSGIEAVLVGWYQRFINPEHARQYIRLARLGMHAAVASVAIGDPVDLTWPDDRLKARLGEIKHAHPAQYDKSKRTVHGSNYGLTPYGAVEQGLFATLAEAERNFGFLHAIAPGLAPWQLSVRKRAKEVEYLGGPTLPGRTPTIWDHPYGYRHAFYDVLSYRPCDEFTAAKWQRDAKFAGRITYLHGRPFKIIWGGDSKRTVAFYPQSTASGRLKEAEMVLLSDPDHPDYIGDCYFGRTPLLVPVHDSLLLIVPNRCSDRVLETVARVMQTPSRHLPIPVEWSWGKWLPIGISAKTGRNWAPRLTEAQAAEQGRRLGYAVVANELGMEEIDVPQVVATSGDEGSVVPWEESEWEDWRGLARAVAS